MRMAEILHRLGYISRNHAVAVTRTISSGSTSGTPRRRPRRCSSAPSSALLGTRNRGRNPLSLDPEHREFEAKKEFGAECRDRRNQRRNKALLAESVESAGALVAAGEAANSTTEFAGRGPRRRTRLPRKGGAGR